jgi:hypothetical protein
LLEEGPLVPVGEPGLKAHLEPVLKAVFLIVEINKKYMV